MREYIRIYRFRHRENSPLFLETDPVYQANDPTIEEAYKILVSLPEDCTLENLIRSAETARNHIVGELGSKLDWGPRGHVVTDDYATSKPLRGKEVFQKKLKNLYDVAVRKFRWCGVECSFESHDEVIKWLDRFSEWAALKVKSVTGTQSTGERGDTPIEMLADPLTLEMREIVTSRKFPSVDKKMFELCRRDARFLSWNSPKWAKLFGTSEAAIKQTKFWKDDRPRLIGDD